MANDNQDMNNEDARKEALRAGLWVLLMLTVLTLGEFLVAVIAPPWGNLLLLVAIWKAFYIVKDYMHVGRLFSGDEENH